MGTQTWIWVGALSERILLEQVRLGDVKPGQRLVEQPSMVSMGTRIITDPEALVYRAGSWMPAPPPGIDETKWGLVMRQLEAIHSVLEEANQDHLGSQAIINLMDEAAVTARKLAVELEAVSAAVYKSNSKTTPS